MPIYEFKCHDGHCTEVITQSSLGNFTTIICPVCREPAIRIMSANTFRLKGSGWYKDGYTKKPE